MGAAMTAMYGIAWIVASNTMIALMASAGVMGNPPDFAYPLDWIKQQSNPDSPVAKQTWSQTYGSCFGRNSAVDILGLGIPCTISATVQQTIAGKFKIPVISQLIDLILMVFATITFLFQVIGYSLNELPALVNFILYVPVGVMLVIVAAQIARGTGTS